MQKITPFLWFTDDAEEAVNLYVSIFDDARIIDTTRYEEGSPGPIGTVMTIDFELQGQRFTALNGGDEYRFNEAVSFVVHCDSQEEVDRYWDALTADGGEPGPCGWLKDRFGVSWQIVPERLLELHRDPDPERRKRVMAAMLQMGKLDLKVLEDA
jgi:predicted 3-demethylubiquinone-9 3-methyltransferase (glyoxalase superfamily)